MSTTSSPPTPNTQITSDLSDDPPPITKDLSRRELADMYYQGKLTKSQFTEAYNFAPQDPTYTFTNLFARLDELEFEVKCHNLQLNHKFNPGYLAKYKLHQQKNPETDQVIPGCYELEVNLTK